METNLLDGVRFARLLESGAYFLGKNRTIVNDLNVFPIPDGDTGDNMYMTAKAGADSCKGRDRLCDAAQEAARGMLMGARGNSGVILSRIFFGISEGFSGVEKAGVEEVSRAMSRGIETAYAAVSHPVEGTMLTVYREAVDRANVSAEAGCTLGEYFDSLYEGLCDSLEKTPDKLQVLADSGVVDSGGAGLVYLTEGAKLGFVPDEGGHGPEKDTAGAPEPDFSLFTENSELEYGYCTELLLRLQTSKVGDVGAYDVSGMKKRVEAAGDSVVFFRDGSIVKIHVHTKNPGDVLNMCREYGEFLKVKIENMTLQHNGADISDRYEHKLHTDGKKPHAIIAVASGKGLRETFVQTGADYVVDGGRSMNPSVGDFVEAIRKVNAKTVFILPNDKNIIFSAQQAAGLCTECDVVVLPTVSIGEGYSVISQADFDAGAEKTESEAGEICEGVRCLSVSRANRDAEINGVPVRSGEFIGFEKDDIFACGNTAEEAAKAMLALPDFSDFGVMLMFYGKGRDETAASNLADELGKTLPDTEIICRDGGQDIYDYLFVLE